MVATVKDLGVFMTLSLSSSEYIVYITSKSVTVLEFIYWTSGDFSSPQTLVSLYKTLVCLLLDYGSVVWSPYQIGHRDMINRTQTRFVILLWYLSCRLWWRDWRINTICSPFLFEEDTLIICSCFVLLSSAQ